MGLEVGWQEVLGACRGFGGGVTGLVGVVEGAHGAVWGLPGVGRDPRA